MQIVRTQVCFWIATISAAVGACVTAEEYPFPEHPAEHGGNAGGAGGGGLSGPEECIDDFECVDAPPTGWNGPLRVQFVIDDPSNGTATSCPGGAAPALYYANPNEMASCSECKCSDMAAECSAPTMKCRFTNNLDSDCVSGTEVTLDSDSEDCISDPSMDLLRGSCILVEASAQVSNEAACSATGGDVVNEPWDTEVRVCSTTGTVTGCGDGEACAPKAADDGQWMLCISNTSGQNCPDKWTGVQMSMFEHIKDDRTCTPCFCDFSSVKCNGGSYTAYDLSNCSSDNGGPIEITTSACVAVTELLDGDTFGVQPHLATAVGNVLCSGGTATGSLAKGAETKLCCKDPS